MEDLLKVGVITTTHGVRGEVKVFPTTDPERFLDLEYVILDAGRKMKKLEIRNVKFFKNLVILKFDGIDNIIDLEKDAAELKAELVDATGQKRARIIKRLEVVESFNSFFSSTESFSRSIASRSSLMDSAPIPTRKSYP